MKPDKVINDAFDRLGSPDITATVGWTWEENDEPEYTQRKGKRPTGYHYQLGNEEGELLDDPHNPDLPVTNVKTRDIFLHYPEE
jgi:hypothetical protein